MIRSDQIFQAIDPNLSVTLSTLPRIRDMSFYYVNGLRDIIFAVADVQEGALGNFRQFLKLRGPHGMPIDTNDAD
jgi:hypothetical protein